MVDVKKILVFVVSGKEGPAEFEPVREIEVKDGEKYRDVIDELANEDERNQGSHEDHSHASDLDIEENASKRSGLDIHLGKLGDPIAIAICLPKHDELNRLVFRGNPIVELETNSDTAEKFIAFVHRHTHGGHRWASFVCNPKEAKNGKLAKLIRDAPPNFDPHKDAMRIPFSYNIIDERLRFATWVLNDHAKVHEHNEVKSHSLLTHGGVHPNFAYYLTMDL